MLRVSPVKNDSSVLVEYGGVRVLWNVTCRNDDNMEFPPHDLVLCDSLTTAPGLALYHRHMKEATKESDTETTSTSLAPIYATFPTLKMGQMAAYSAHAAIAGDGGKPFFSLEDVDGVMAHCTPIKYAQTISVSSGGEKDVLEITAHPAGHVVGSSLWILRRPVDGTAIVLSPQAWNLASELHLKGSNIASVISAPDAWIGYPGATHTITKSLTPRIAQRQLVDAVLQVLRRDGNVLIPTDTAGRALEVALILQQAWKNLGQTYNVVLVGQLAPAVLEFASCQLEWMHPQLGKTFDERQENPWQLRDLHVCTRTSQVLQLLQENPSCIICADDEGSLESGAGRDLLLQWTDNDAILLVNPCDALQKRVTTNFSGDSTTDDLPGTPTQTISEFTVLGQLWQANHDQEEIPLQVWCRVQGPLQGQELLEYKARMEAQQQERQKRAQEQELLAQVQVAKGQLRLEDDTVVPTTTAVTHSRPRKKSRFDQGLFLKFSKPLHLTFPVHDPAIGIGLPPTTANVIEDEYGIGIEPDTFVDIVSGVDTRTQRRLTQEIRGLGYATAAQNENDEDLQEAMDLSEGYGIVRGKNGGPPELVSRTPRQIALASEIKCLDLSGRVNASTARQTLRALQPRRCVILGGGPSATELAQAAESFLPSTAQVCTLDDEPVTLNVGHAAYAVRLLDAPLPTEEDEDPAVVETHQEAVGRCQVSLLDCIATGQRAAVDGSLVLTPNPESAVQHEPILLSDGDVVLTDLRTELMAKGLKVEYKVVQNQQYLWINQRIRVTKDQDGKLEVEGPLCDDFYRVRQVVCGQFVVL